MPIFNFSERLENQVVIVDLYGIILFGEAPLQFHRLIRKLFERGEKRILLNFAEGSFIDSSGLGEFV
jgi:anti-sigma B factor antagonist